MLGGLMAAPPPTLPTLPLPQMWVRVYKPSRRVYWTLEAINIFSFILTILALIGAIYWIVIDAKNYVIFG